MSSSADVRIELVESEADFPPAFEAAAHAFGHQARDAIWRSMNPGWDTPEGVEKCSARLAKRWRGVTSDRDGNPNTVFLKATVPDPEGTGGRAIAGLAIWQQCSAVDGRGEPVAEDTHAERGMDELYPGDEDEQRFLSQAIYSLHKPRLDRVKEIAGTDRPSLLALDLCAVHPRFQRRGIAGKLVEWGLAEAERRGGLEAVMEASVMGRPVYKRVGFEEVVEIVYNVDEEFRGRDMPPNVFMRWRPASA